MLVVVLVVVRFFYILMLVYGILFCCRYSALSMDGKRLYDYAREGIPLPREIPSRKVQIHGLDLLSFVSSQESTTEWQDARLVSQYGFQPPGKRVVMDSSSSPSPSQSSLGLITGFRPKTIPDPASVDPDHIPIPPHDNDDETGGRSVYFHIQVHCSSGTYIRTLIADIAAELGTVGHMTDLLRVEQSGYRLGDPATLELADCENLERIDRAIQAGNIVWDSRAQAEEPESSLS